MKAGLIPGEIVKEAIEWVITSKLWVALEFAASKTNNEKLDIAKGVPQTPLGILNLSRSYSEQLGYYRNFAALRLLQNIMPIVEIFVREILPLSERNHIHIGKNAFQIIEKTKEILNEQEIAHRDFSQLRTLNTYFYFNVAEKLRELINIHARRSRHLY